MGRKIGVLLFLLPVVVLGSVVVYSYILTTTAPVNGTLVVKSIVYTNSLGENKSLELKAVFFFQGKAYTAPRNFSLLAGTYSVTFQQIEGLYQASQCTVTVIPGKTAYCIGSYKAMPKTIQFTGNEFVPNETSAYANITPVIWINNSKNNSVFYLQSYGKVILLPGQSFSYIFNSSGIFSFYSVFSKIGGEIKVIELS